MSLFKHHLCVNCVGDDFPINIVSNKCDVILNTRFLYLLILGSLFLSTNIVSRTNARVPYWSQFISHEIHTVKGIKWYFSNILLVRCGCIASIDEVAKCNNYVDSEAIHIYQSCYQDKK